MTMLLLVHVAKGGLQMLNLVLTVSHVFDMKTDQRYMYKKDKIDPVCVCCVWYDFSRENIKHVISALLTLVYL